jgi:hypothetical protein
MRAGTCPRLVAALISAAAALVAPASLAGCRDVAPATDAAIDGDGWPYAPPRTDVVAAVGSPATLEIATWNIENFPADAGTPRYVAELIASLELDVIVVLEIADEAEWRERLDRQREHEGVLSSHTFGATSYQKIGVIYRAGLVTVGAPR